jgi:hypothetical protein
MFFNELPDFIQLVRRGFSTRERMEHQRRGGSTKGAM